MSEIKPSIVTYNGHEVNLVVPTQDTIDAIDIAHALSLLNRFTGHTVLGYSVAQHSVVGSILSEMIYPEVKWLPHAFILHDAMEAYLGDVSSPLKSLLPGYRDIESRFREVIGLYFAVSLGGTWEKLVDLRMLATERKLFMPESNTLWVDEKPPFTLEEFTNSVNGQEFKDISTFWDWLWTPWEAQEAEQMFLQRLEKLGL